MMDIKNKSSVKGIDWNKTVVHMTGFVFFFLCLVLPQHAVGQVYKVGPGHPHKNLKSVGWDKLQPGDVVEIYPQEMPYREKRVSGTKNQPIIIRGISDTSGRKPVLDGENAVGFQKMDIRLARRALIVVGGSQNRADHLILENLELRNANNTRQFIYNNKKETYAHNGSGIFVQNGRNVIVRDCTIHSCCIGVQTAYYPDVDNFILRSNFIFNNGDFTRNRWGHNVYLQAGKTLIEFNRFGELYSDGNNIKDRSRVVVIRYNWIEGGQSRQIDLVETSHYPVANAYVYGNVIISGKKIRNPKMILFGGDLPEQNLSRSGTLYFFNNTVHFTHNRMDAFIFVNRANCNVLVTNNAFLGGGQAPRISMGPGRVTGSCNLISLNSVAEGLSNSFYGGPDEFHSVDKINYFPHKFSVLVNRGTSQLPAKLEYLPNPDPGRKTARRITGKIDIGAFEYIPQG